MCRAWPHSRPPTARLSSARRNENCESESGIESNGTKKRDGGSERKMGQERNVRALGRERVCERVRALAPVLHRTLTLRYRRRRLPATALSHFGLSHLFRRTLSFSLPISLVLPVCVSLSHRSLPFRSSAREIVAVVPRARSLCLLIDDESNLINNC